MKRFLGVFLSLSIFVLLTVSLSAQQNPFSNYLEYNNVGGGARAAGMGNAYLGISEGEMAYSWNPAGMIFTKKTLFGLQFLSISDKFQSIQRFGAPDTASNYPYEFTRKHSPINYFGFVAPVTFMDREWAIGGGYRNILDMNFKFTAPSYFNSTETFIQTGGIDAISAAVSNKLTEGVGIGVTANYFMRYYEYNDFIGKAIELTLPGNPTPDTFDVRYHDNSHFSGLNFDIGLIGEYNIARGSLVIHTPYSLKQNSIYSWFIMVPPEPPPTLTQINRITYTAKYPLSYSFGISVKPINNLLIDFDADIKPMSKVKTTQKWESMPDTSYTYKNGWQDLSQFRFGAEYTYDANFGKIALRAGGMTLPLVNKQVTAIDSANHSTYGNQVKPFIITFGTGVKFEKAWIDLAYQFGTNSYNSQISYGTVQTLKVEKKYSRLLISAGMYF